MEGLHPDVAEVLLSEQDIRDIVTRMGAEITRDYEGRNPLIVAVLRGAVVFTADIMRAIKCDLGIDFMAVSSYGDGVKSSRRTGRTSWRTCWPGRSSARRSG